MPRNLLIRGADGRDALVEEAELMAEKDLHDVLSRYPALVPAEDLDMGPIVVVGRESGLASGYADLVLLDRSAQVCLVEVKKEGNPDTRRVIAQLMDYAAALWQMSAEDFERDVLHPFLRSEGRAEAELPELGAFVDDALAEDSETDDTVDDFRQRLEQSLAAGQFRLVVAAPSIPSGVQQVIEYLNSQGLRIYGLEVSFFSGPAECFVPRLVVRPQITEMRRLRTGSTPVDEASFLRSLPERVQTSVESFLRASEAAGGTITWNSYGPGVRAPRTPPRLVAFLERKRAGIVVTAPTGYPSEPFAEARDLAAALGTGNVSSDGWYYTARYDDLTDAQLNDLFSVALHLLDTLSPKIAFTPLPDPVESTFERNDHMIWAKSVPVLDQYVGRWLRGTITRLQTSAAAEVDLEPMAGGAPGWRPRLTPTSARETVWPVGDLSGEMKLEIKLIESTADVSPS
jgi:hypothetical protein